MASQRLERMGAAGAAAAESRSAVAATLAAAERLYG